MAPGRLPAGERVRDSLALSGGRIGDDIPDTFRAVEIREPPGNDPVEVHSPSRGEQRPAVLLQSEDLEQRTGVVRQETRQRRTASGQRRRPQVGFEPGKVEGGERGEALTRCGPAEWRAVPV